MKSKEFSLKIEKIAKEKRCSLMDAILEFCKEKDLDPGTVGSLISKPLKEKIKADAIRVKTIERVCSACHKESYHYEHTTN